ncbi:conserved hypothetical protein [Neospora caninum Liverpool]|uniref:Uncharacterized protein n=1 Tax=Neospora caninum (strain Liverpool) TaxID=572307 RepID=F0VKI2_NEOCL|nr:conserved hypothetical protein [Neospora caninum Liverpool]CBZ54583.1 conserved hypothetical protein [Neospora caninum Liverpool]CEL69296.1 TPA: hypothetical protein BN1204_050110 [Neospora caninum Liverpool]|eukprot:XP_003884613.1 conserved hypothetical protein [Neospora caninum Liverpool]
MSSRLFDHQRTTDTLFEEELKRKSSESDDWKCYHSHRLFYSQCRDFGALGGRSGVRTPEGDGRLAAAATESKQESEDGKEEAAGDLPGEIPVDFLCSRLEGELQKCRESLARYLPDETPAMKEITDITNLPPWLKDRPVYVQYFERKAKQRNREEAQANDEETDSSSCSCSL